eukprot:7381852-Prymnesium_polylepis.1
MDVGRHIEQFAKDNGYEVKDISRMFERHNSSIRGVNDAYMLINDRSKKYPNTIHYIVTSAYNLEAIAKFLDAIIQVEDSLIRSDIVPVLGHEMLHAVVFQNGYKLPMRNVKCSSQVAAALKCFEPENECVICFTEFALCETGS